MTAGTIADLGAYREKRRSDEIRSSPLYKLLSEVVDAIEVGHGNPYSMHTDKFRHDLYEKLASALFPCEKA